MTELDVLLGKIDELAKNLMQAQIDQYMAVSIVLNLVLRHDERLRSETSEAIRRILTTPIPGREISPGAADLLRSFRDDLVAESSDEVAREFKKPPIRPVE